uniref:cytochrome c oxidase subunit III n=1 Tax=Physaloptera clausa TaxID=3051302 RepID=UPI0030028CA6|nr:cytochrome c oxidase subunit III [Physaloptera clausa]
MFWGLLGLDINLLMLMKFGVMLGALFCLLFIFVIMVCWFKDVFYEDISGQYTYQDCRVYRQGFRLFLFSELILFLTIFWCFLDSALCPVIWIGGVWSPWGLLTPDYLGLNALASIFLMMNSQLLKYSIRYLKMNSKKCEMITLLSLMIGGGFICFQVYEYTHMVFSISDGIYGCIFFSGTGLHGSHVFIGVCFLLTSFIRIKLNHLNWEFSQSYVLMIDYWRFLEWMWGVMFSMFYVWGA